MYAGITGALARRVSLLTPGANGLPDLAGPVTGEGRKNKNKANKKARKRCKRQANQCTEFFIDGCDDDPVCLERLACCDSAGNCDVAGFIACVISPG